MNILISILCLLSGSAPQIFSLKLYVNHNRSSVGDYLKFKQTDRVRVGSVTAVSHTIAKIADYNKKSRSFDYFTGGRFDLVNPDEVFTDLPALLTSSHSILLSRVDNVNSLQFSPLVKESGVYVISCCWHYSSGHTSHSIPILIYVSDD